MDGDVRSRPGERNAGDRAHAVDAGGSPLGGVDMTVWTGKKRLDEARMHFRPGVNEEVAATAVHGHGGERRRIREELSK